VNTKYKIYCFDIASFAILATLFNTFSKVIIVRCCVITVMFGRPLLFDTICQCNLPCLRYFTTTTVSAKHGIKVLESNPVSLSNYLAC